tara:strand:+ start:181777 stop:182217 length:441 start_codon:yes stop_codon:yes gene_type:complete
MKKVNKIMMAAGIMLASSLILSAVATASTSTSVSDETVIITLADTSEVYNVAEKMPELIGGLAEVYKNIEYPKLALQNNIQGRVFLRFIVDENGQVKNPQILKDIGAGCGQAAIEGIRKVKFKPGEQGGKKVSVYYSLPINFQIKG